MKYRKDFLRAIPASLVISCFLCSCSIVDSDQTKESIQTNTPQVATKDQKPSATSIPVPSPLKSLVANIPFDCLNLMTELNLKEYSEASTYTPQESSAEERALNSGGYFCFWNAPEVDKWVKISIEKLSPEDYRDFGVNLGALFSKSDFGSKNNSLEFFQSYGSESTIKILNSTYLISVESNLILDEQSLGKLGHKTELFFTR